MFVLGPRSRTLLAGAAFASFAASFVATPLIARSSGDAPLPRAVMPPQPRSMILAAVSPHRDPFADVPVAASPTPSPSHAAGALVPATLGPLPPNAGAPGLPFALRTSRTRVTAVATGQHPFAVVDEGATTRIVTLGDRVDGEAIVAIRAGGMRLEGGRVFAVDPVIPSTTVEQRIK